MESTREEFERKAGYLKSLYIRERHGKYRDDYINAKWYGFLLAREHKGAPNKV